MQLRPTSVRLPSQGAVFRGRCVREHGGDEAAGGTAEGCPPETRGSPIQAEPGVIP